MSNILFSSENVNNLTKYKIRYKMTKNSLWTVSGERIAKSALDIRSNQASGNTLFRPESDEYNKSFHRSV